MIKKFDGLNKANNLRQPNGFIFRDGKWIPPNKESEKNIGNPSCPSGKCSLIQRNDYKVIGCRSHDIQRKFITRQLANIIRQKLNTIDGINILEIILEIPVNSIGNIVKSYFLYKEKKYILLNYFEVKTDNLIYSSLSFINNGIRDFIENDSVDFLRRILIEKKLLK